MVRPKRKEDRTLVVRLGPGDLSHNVLTHSRETNGQRSTAELEVRDTRTTGVCYCAGGTVLIKTGN